MKKSRSAGLLKRAIWDNIYTAESSPLSRDWKQFAGNPIKSCLGEGTRCPEKLLNPRIVLPIQQSLAWALCGSARLLLCSWWPPRRGDGSCLVLCLPSTSSSICQKHLRELEKNKPPIWQRSSKWAKLSLIKSGSVRAGSLLIRLSVNIQKNHMCTLTHKAHS